MALKKGNGAGITVQCVERSIEFDDSVLARDLFGPGGSNLQRLSALSGVRLSSHGATLNLSGADEIISRVVDLLVQLYEMLRKGRPLLPEDIDHGWSVLLGANQQGDSGAVDLSAAFRQSALKVSPRKTVAPRSAAQRDYVRAMMERDMVFGIGPAGTGKTYLAVAVALKYLHDRKVKRIVLTRPAVEAGERLGFLPGDLAEKVNPYLRPLYDALYDMLDIDRAQKMIERGLIEIAPIAFMRGRTLNDSFVILDEAQNTTSEQMKMFLTRLGYDSKAVVTGDITQIDLPSDKNSGLKEVQRILKDVRGVNFTYFSKTDVVRHKLVQDIIDAYDKEDARKQKKQQHAESQK